MKKRFTRVLAALALLVGLTIPMGMWGQTRAEITWTASQQGYTNGQEISNVVFNDVVSGTFAKGTNTNVPKYYTNGTAIRCYGGNTISISSNGDNLTGISIAFGENDGSNAITTNVGTYSEGNWTGDAKTVVFTIGGSSGNRRIAGFTITYGGTPTPTCASPVFNPAAGTYTEAQEVSITCATEEATIYYTTDGEDPTTESDVYSTPLNIEETTTVKAMAAKQGMNNSGVVTAVYTIEAPAPAQTFSKIDGHNPVAGQTYLIVDLNSGKALSSANGSSASPAAVEVTIENNQITTNEEELQWTFEVTDGGYIIHPLGSSTTWLYTNNSSNTGVRVGTNNDAKVWTLDITDNATDYHGFMNNAYERYLGVYQGTDWRTYTTIHANIKDTQIALFVLGEAPAPTPSISANAVNIPYNATNGQITFTISNPVEDATIVPEIASGATINDFVLGDEITSPISFTCAANDVTEVRTATVTLNYVKNGETLATKNVTVTQAAAPVIYSSIEAIFNAATSAETNVKVSFGGWVVTGVKGSQAFVSDGTNGLIIYQSDHGFVAGNTLTGTVDCRLVLYYGAAELKGVTNGMEGLTVGTGGSVTPQVVTASQLTNGIKTGAVLTFENLAYNGSNFSDGTNTITVKTDMYDYSEDVEEGNSYTVTGVYEHSLRIYPRSETDIVEYVPVTVPALYDYSINGVEGETNDATVGQTITLPDNVEDINDDYTFAGWTIDPANIILINGSYTISQEVTTFYAVYAHTTGATPGGEANYVKVTSTDEIANGNYLIVYEDALVAFDGSLETLDAVNNTIEVEIEDGVIAADEDVNGSIFTISATEGGYTVKSASGYYIGTTAYNNELRTSTTPEYVNAISFDDDNVLIQMSYNSGDVTLKFNSASNQARFRYYKSGQQNIQLYKYTGGGTPGVTEYYTLVKFMDVDAYEGNGGYVLVASPVSTTPAKAGMITDTEGANATPQTATYDLYSFDQTQELEWVNYRQGEFGIEPGKGYLYANKNDVTLTFTGTPYNNQPITLTKTQGAQFEGWNLIGNPYATAATPGTKPFYRMNGDGSGLNSSTETGLVNPMEGIFVVAETAGETVTFTQGAAKSVEQVVVNLTRNRGTVIDNAIVRFDEGSQLPKFQLFENSTKLYIQQGNKDYAIVRSAAEAEMPVSFRASENGTYTLAVEAENVEMNYLHLIDNLTGMDVDLLQTPSYTFEAKTSDYASRFRLVFSANSIDEQNAETFAYFNGTNWTVSNVGDATLQVVDVTGRTVANQMINGNAELNLNQPAGVYVIRLVNGDNVKTQKVVVR